MDKEQSYPVSSQNQLMDNRCQFSGEDSIMCISSTVPSRPEPTTTVPALLRFWLITRFVRRNLLTLPAGLGNLTPHMRHDIGLEQRAAVHWSDATAYIDRDPRRP
jgi:hypothetical protein